MAQPTEATANIVRPARSPAFCRSCRRAARKRAGRWQSPRKALMVSWAPSMLVARSRAMAGMAGRYMSTARGVRPARAPSRMKRKRGRGSWLGA